VTFSWDCGLTRRLIIHGAVEPSPASVQVSGAARTKVGWLRCGKHRIHTVALGEEPGDSVLCYGEVKKAGSLDQCGSRERERKRVKVTRWAASKKGCECRMLKGICRVKEGTVVRWKRRVVRLSTLFSYSLISRIASDYA
jgi:hypothetical protein